MKTKDKHESLFFLLSVTKTHIFYVMLRYKLTDTCSIYSFVALLCYVYDKKKNLERSTITKKNVCPT